MTPEELVQSACPLIGEMGWAFYFAPETAARTEPYGLDLLSFYAIGRGGVLGDAEAAVVHSAFAYFKPSLVEETWDTAKQAIDPREAARVYRECCNEFGRNHLSAVKGLDAYCEAAETVVRAADPQGLTLFAGAARQPLPDDPPARAMQLTTVLREYRGSAHLAAVVASGLAPVKAHFIARPEMWEVFGWQDGDKPECTDADRRALEAAEAMTDRIVLPAYAAVPERGREAMVKALLAMQAALAA
jgi:hypothetical protein